MGQTGQGIDASRAGVAMAALLVGLSIMAIMMTVALPAWSHAVRREREAELVWRGEQYQRAIRLFQRKFANTFPATIDLLVEQKFLRRKYKDPITGEDFQMIPVGAALRPVTSAPGGRPPADGSRAAAAAEAGPGQPSNTALGAMAPQALGVQGVVSKSRGKSIRLYNGASTYDTWYFIGTAAVTQGGTAVGGGGSAAPRPGLPPNTGGGVSTPFGQPNPFSPRGGTTSFGSPTSPPPATFQPQLPGALPGATPPGTTPAVPGGLPVFGGGGTRPPVTPAPAWRPR